MHFRRLIPGFLAALILASGAGCKKSGYGAPSAPLMVSSPDTVARVHWLGKKRLGIAAGAYYFSRIWQLPQSAQLEAQTLDKLSTAPWRLLPDQSGLANAPAALLRPLLNDLVQEESCLEIRRPANQSGETVFAIRLDDAQAGQWRTNFAVVMQSLTGAPAVATPDGRGWSLKKSTVPNLIELTRAGDWTLVGLAQDTNSLLAEIAARAARDHPAFSVTGTNYWLEADFDPSRAAAALGLDCKSPENLPRVFIGVNGDGGTVFTRARLTFPQPLPVQLEPWDIPDNLLHEPLTGFTAVRGVKPWLASCKMWSDLQIGAPPGQLYFWSLQGSPFQTYLAAPLPDASNQMALLTGKLLQNGNAWLAAHGYVNFDRASDSNGVTWGNLPSIKPFIKTAAGVDGGFIFAGLLPDTNADAGPPPAGMIQDVLSRTNLVYYNWEVSAPRVAACLYLGQTVRQILRLAQLPVNSVSEAWLYALAPRLGTSATVVTLTEANQLTLFRRSTAGLTGAELQLLADWLESPQFPRGLHTLAAPADAPPPH
jgi:hypothetical protein